MEDRAQGLLRLARQRFRRAPLPRGAEAELFVQEEDARTVSWSEGKPRDLRRGTTSGAAVRLIERSRQGFASGSDLSQKGIDRLFIQARESARAVLGDSARCLPGPAIHDGPVKPPNGALLTASPRALWDRLAGLEKSALRAERWAKKILRLSFDESRGAFAVVNSRGVAIAESQATVSFGVEILGERGGATETVWGSADATAWRTLDPESVCRDALERLRASLGGTPLSSGRWPVLVAPRVGVEFLEVASQALSAEAAQRGRSCWGSRRGKTVAAPAVTLIDDGRLPGGLGSGVWDGEGVLQQRTPLVDAGRLRTFLHTTETARRAGVPGTGNAVREGRSSAPQPGPTNFFMAPGSVPRKDLLNAAPRLFWLWDVIGMHTVDPASGDFSVGASGVLVERGRVQRGVRGVTLAGNLGTFFSRVDGVADDLSWQGALGAPSFLVNGVSLGGS